MVVQCEHCQNKYRIADEKVKGKGVKVRCAKCENVFTVTPPENDVQAPHVVHQAPEPPSPPEAAPPVPDQPAPQSDGGPELGHTNGVMESSEPPATVPPAPEPPGFPPLSSLNGLQSPTGQQPLDATNLDPASGGQAPSPFDEESADPSSQRPAHEMDQSGLVSPSADPADQQENVGFEIEATLREEPLGSLESAGLPPLTQEADQDGEWGNIPIDGQGAPDSSGGDFGLAGEPSYEPPPPVPMEESADQALPDHMDHTGHGTSPVPAYEPESRRSGGGKKGILAFLLLAILGGGGYFAYPTVMEIIQSRGQQTEGTLTPANVQVKMLNRSDGKIIYSVRGEVRNDSAGNVGMVQVEAQFRNAAGDVISTTTSYCGNLFEDGDLVNLDLAKVQSDLQNELGQSLSNASIAPGKTVPFLVILDNPPSGVSKVTVTISSFKETT